MSDALALPLSEIVVGRDEPRADLSLTVQLLSRLSGEQLEEARRLLQARFSLSASPAARSSRVALIGLRGAGKSTLGKMLSAALSYRFIELDHTIEDLSGMDATQIHGMLGQSVYRRHEFEALRSIVEDVEGRIVLAAPGSIVSEPETYSYLLSNCFTVWIKASPQEHMARVIAQGDMRPMSGNREAMDDLRRILAARDSLYAKADAAIDTSSRSVDEAFAELRRTVTATHQSPRKQ